MDGMQHEKRMASEDVQACLHECEILSILRIYYNKGPHGVKSYLLLVEKERGTAAAERLRMETAARLGLGKKKK